jgi:tRNA(Ile)-lysidine synthetase-like protein
VVDLVSDSLVQAVRIAVEPYNTLIVGVSGGVDSCVLLDVLTCEAIKNKKIIVAHVNHNLRESSHRDADFVNVLASRYKIPVHTFDATPPDKGNMEGWGRQVRYTFFKELKDSFHADAVVTAHTKSDQHELYLMRLFSNKPFSPMLHFEERRSLLRPLLNFSKAQILDYARNKSLEWVEDETNADNEYLRNRTRNVVIPTLRAQYGNSIDEVISDQIEQSIETEALYSTIVSNLEESLLPFQEFSKDWKKHLESILKEQIESVRWRFMDKLFFDHFSQRLGRSAGLRLADFFLSNAPQLQLPHGKTVRRIQGEIRFEDS